MKYLEFPKNLIEIWRYFKIAPSCKITSHSYSLVIFKWMYMILSTWTGVVHYHHSIFNYSSKDLYSDHLAGLDLVNPILHHHNRSKTLIASEKILWIDPFCSKLSFWIRLKLVPRSVGFATRGHLMPSD